MCLQFGYSKQAYYKQSNNIEKSAVVEDVVVGLIKKKREIWKRGSGRNLHQSLKKEFREHQIKLGRDKFFDVLRQNNLLIKPKRIRAKTTCSYHHFNKYPNLIEAAVPLRCNEIWVSDITYIWLKEQDKFCYLNLITDLYSRKIVGHCVYEDLSVKGSVIALQQALKQRTDKTLSLGRDQFFVLQTKNKLLVRKTKRSVHTTNSKHHFRRYPNLIKDFTPLKAHELWVCDITYIPLKDRFAYLFLITDAYSRKIVGHHVSDDMKVSFAVVALKKALEQKPVETIVIHHSDRVSNIAAMSM